MQLKNVIGRRRLLWLVCSAVVVLPSTSRAGRDQASLGGQSARSRTHAPQAMWAALELSDAQAERVRTIHMRFAPAIKLAKKRPGDAASQIFGREMAEVRMILSPSQQQTLDSYMTGSVRQHRRSVARVLPARIAIPRP